MTATAESVGLSSERLGNITTKFQGYVDNNQAPGFVILIARKGEIAYYETIGYSDLESQTPVEKDSIFRIYSMTKPITSVALMTLYEQGKFHLSDPVSKYIPAFGKTKVLKRRSNGKTKLVAQESPMTIQNVLTHTAGLTYELAHDNPDPDKEAKRAALFNDETMTLQDKIKEIAKLPLICQPGSDWTYGIATDVCGYLVEVLSGMPFDTYLQEKIFTPLGMDDTAFHVTDEKSDRLATLYAHNLDTGDLQVHEDTGNLQRDFLVPTKSPFGGHGLVSTTKDYWTFIQMMLNKGEYEGARILGRKTVDYMSMNHLKSELLPYKHGGELQLGLGFGLGFAVVEDPAQAGVISSVGTYYWGGAAATGFWIDPQEEMVAVIMTQIRDCNLPLGDDLRTVTYQALID
ncbi:MAG: serine hydrolase [Anaerolineaceae bacterium]|nr:serine hydrolase [Anaerolineaceae bacterium]